MVKNAGPVHTLFPVLFTVFLFLSCAFSLHLLFCHYFFLIICSSHLISPFSLYLAHKTLTWLYSTCTKNTHNCTHTVPGSVSCVTLYPAPCFAVRSHIFMDSYNKQSSEKCYADKCVYLYFFSLTWELGQTHEMKRLTSVTFYVMKPHYQVLLQA